MEDAKVLALLEEIRDLNREQLAEYRKQTERSVALAERAVVRQELGLRLYKGGLVAGALVLLVLLAFLAWSLLR